MRDDTNNGCVGDRSGGGVLSCISYATRWVCATVGKGMVLKQHNLG